MSRNPMTSLLFGAVVGAAACMAGAGQAWAAWAAVAADSRGSWGYAVGQPDKATAERLATSGCGNRRCRIIGSADAQCIAYWHFTGGGYWFGVGIGQQNRHVNRGARLRPSEKAMRGEGSPMRLNSGGCKAGTALAASNDMQDAGAQNRRVESRAE